MDIVKEVSIIKQNYYKGTVTIMDGLTFSQYNTILQIEFYTNSKYLNGMYDEFNRFKPFYNIVNFRVNTATKATDLDTKDIQVYTENPEYYVKSMIFNKDVKNWMRKTYFSKSLNEIGFTRAKYGGVLAKRVMRNGELYIEVPEWKNMVTDQVSIKDGVKIEKHYMTPVQIQAKKGIWKGIENNMDTIEKALKATNGGKYTNSSRICVLEVEGQFPKKYLEGDDETYSLQHYFILCDQNENPVAELHGEELKASNYKYLPYLTASGRGLGIGVVEDGFQAQIAINDTVLKEKDILEIAGKTILMTDSDILENNILSDVQTGDIMKIEKGEQLGMLNTTPASLPQLSNIMEKWDEQYSRVSSTFESITGETMPSGTPFRAVAIQNQEAQSTFNYRKEEMGIWLNELFTDWIIPHVKKQLSKEHILAAEFEDDELEQIDESFSRFTARNIVIERALQGKVTTAEEYESMLDAELQALNTGFKKKRFIDVPKDYFKDVEFKLDIITTGEQINKAAMFETLANIVQYITDPVKRNKVMGKIIELSGLGLSPAIFDAPDQAPVEAPVQHQTPQSVILPEEEVVMSQ